MAPSWDSSDMTYEVHTVQIESQRAAVLTATIAIPEIWSFLGSAFDEVLAVLARAAVAVDGKPFARYEMGDGVFHIEAGFPCPPDLDLDGDVRTITLPAGMAAVTTHVGPYDAVLAVEGAYRAIETWFATTGHRSTGAPWETYLDGQQAEQPGTILTWPCTLA